jgi:hypothetical protein
MDELWEAMSWAQLGYHAEPIGLLNVAGYYDNLIDFNRAYGARSASCGRSTRGCPLVDSDLDGLLEKMAKLRAALPIIRMAREEPVTHLPATRSSRQRANRSRADRRASRGEPVVRPRDARARLAALCLVPRRDDLADGQDHGGA